MLFLGAGASKPLGIPTMAEFTDVVLKDLSERNVNFEPLVRDIQKQVASFGLNADIEAVLTVLEAKTHPKKALADVGPSVILFAPQYRNIAEDVLATVAIREIEETIYNRCMQINHDLAFRLYGNLWDALAKDVGLPNPGGGMVYRGYNPLSKIFTTNYDISLESFLKRRRIGYDEGFHEDSVADSAFDGNWGGGRVGYSTFLFKLHGSINYYEIDDKIVRSNTPLETTFFGQKVTRPRMIYPTGEKYATRWPFYEYLGHLRAALAEEPVCIVIGYSFRDIPITNAFVDGVRNNSQLRVFLIGPSAGSIRDTLDSSLQKHVLALHGEFGNELLPQSILERVRDWRLA